MSDSGDAKNLMAQADAQARADLPADADTATRKMYSGLLFKKMMRRHKNEDEHVKQIAIQEINNKLKSIKDRAHSAKFDRFVARETQAAQGFDPLAAFASQPSFKQYTKKGAAPGQEPVAVISREEADIFILDIKDKARAKGVALSFKNLFDLAVKKFGITKQNLDTPAMAHLKAALHAQQAAEKQRAAEQEKAKRDATLVTQPEIDVFMDELKNSPGYAPGDILTMIDRATAHFGMNVANCMLPRFELLKNLLVHEMAAQGYADAGQAESTLELLMG
jgi:hypothetical protein